MQRVHDGVSPWKRDGSGVEDREASAGTRRNGSVVTAAFAVAAAIVLVASGCGGPADASDRPSGSPTPAEAEPDRAGDAEGPEDADDERPDDAVPVEVEDLARGDIESLLRFSSNLEAERHVEVHAQASRLVTGLLVEEGDTVERGELLARLQDDEQRSELAKVESELAKARREYEQQQRLFAERLVSEQAFREFTYNLEQLELRLEDAQRMVAYTEVRAPIEGVVTRRLVQYGDHIVDGEHLFDIVDFDSIVALVYVPEKHLGDLASGKTARISAPSLGGRTFSARVDRVAPVVDPKTGTIKVTVAVGRQARLRPGLYVDVDLVTDVHESVVLLPKRALVYDDDRAYAFRVVEGDDGDPRVERVSIDTIVADRDHVFSGDAFDEGDRIVIAGQVGLKDGARVEIPGDAIADAGASATPVPEAGPGGAVAGAAAP